MWPKIRPYLDRRMIIMLIVVAVVFGGIFGFKAVMSAIIRKFMSSMGSPPQTVSTTVADFQQWQPQLESVGSLRAVMGADLAFDVAGVVESISFNSGDDVNSGTLLVQLRAHDDIAKLQSLQASADLSKITYDRDQKQLKIQAISQATLDTDAANLRNAQAQVAEQQAVVDKKMLRAPFTGHIGIRAVDVGQYVAPGTTVVTLQALDPIFLDFYLPQQAIDEIALEQKVTVKVDTFPDQTFDGEISAINPKIDSATRNVQIRATLKNADRKLLPGMYATVDIATGKPQRYITLPQTAVTFNPYGETVYIVDDKGKDSSGKQQLNARQTFVKTGLTRGDQVAIVSGLQGGETVVTAGQIKLHNGSPLIINNSVTPSANPAPKPVDQ